MYASLYAPFIVCIGENVCCGYGSAMSKLKNSFQCIYLFINFTVGSLVVYMNFLLCNLCAVWLWHAHVTLVMLPCIGTQVCKDIAKACTVMEAAIEKDPVSPEPHLPCCVL